MKVNGINGGNDIQDGNFVRSVQMDSVSKNIQNQIANEQKKLQELSSNKELSAEEKMKKRQEIQQQINQLQQQLRQHELEQKREQTQKAVMEDMHTGGQGNVPQSENQGTGLSQEGMQALISADSSIRQAKVQSSAATRLEGTAKVLESEIRTDRGKGAGTEQKEKELADIQTKVQAAQAAGVSALADANRTLKEAAATGRTTETKAETADPAERTVKASEKGEAVSKNAAAPETRANAETSGQTEAPAAGQNKTQPAGYPSIDIRL